MCGRFVAKASPEEVARWFNVVGPVPNTVPTYNAAPTMDLPVIAYNKDTRERLMKPLRWGLIPYWAKDPKVAFSTINAACETVATKPAFKEPFARRRCLVPASGFYEWQKVDEKTKQPYWIGMTDGSLFAFAGLWERWKDPKSGEAIRSFTIITCPPNELCAPIHNRMPVILDPADYGRWLGEEPANQNELQQMLRPFPAERMRAYRIGPQVGNVKNDDPSLIEAIAG
jgi:putative SOS response-associated peptidase YedK